jgi:hypothetical protein
MQGALKRLLEGAIDYAGLFPPAKLPMKESVDNYLRYRHGPEAWILDRFVCGVGRLPELLAELSEHTPDEVNGRDPLAISVVGTASPDHKHWGHGLEHDAAEMAKFQKAAERRAEIVAFEIRLPDHQNLNEYLRDLRGFDEADLFVELPWGPEMTDSLAICAEAGGYGVKARTGGIEAAAFPSSADLAAFIQSCVQLDLNFKCTAGLHSALRHRDPLIGTHMHGFLNVLVGTALTFSEDLSKREIEKILEETDADAFQFSDLGLSWRDHRATNAQIEEARELFVGFGSCSVEEPIEEIDRLQTH